MGTFRTGLPYITMTLLRHLPILLRILFAFVADSYAYPKKKAPGIVRLYIASLSQYARIT
jgi:hypothetical protein